QLEEIVVRADGPHVHFPAPDLGQPALDIVVRILEEGAPAVGNGRREVLDVHRNAVHDQHSDEALTQLPPHVITKNRPAHVLARLDGGDGATPPAVAHGGGLGPAHPRMCGQHLGNLRQRHHGCSPLSTLATSLCISLSRNRSAWSTSSETVRAPST